MNAILVLSLVLTIFIVSAALRIRQRSLQRQQVVSGLLDAADALEARLRAARSEIEAIAGDHRNPVRAAMQDILRQRLWLQEHAADADLVQLQAVRDALDQARDNLDEQLRLVARARGAA